VQDKFTPEICPNILQPSYEGSLLPRGAEEFDLPGRGFFPPRVPPLQPRGPNQSPIYIYEYFRERARSSARKPGVYSGIRRTHRALLVAPSSSASSTAARGITKNGEITGVYFCESSWILLSWPYFVAPARLRVRHDNHGWREERNAQRERKENGDPRNSNALDRYAKLLHFTLPTRGSKNETKKKRKKEREMCMFERYCITHGKNNFAEVSEKFSYYRYRSENSYHQNNEV